MKNMYLARSRKMCYARIDLRDCHLYIRDGLTGTAAIKHSMGYMAAVTSIDVDGVDTNTDANLGGNANEIPVGARLLIAGDTSETIYTVTAASDSMGTWTLTISPGIGEAVADDAVVDILPQQVEIKVGEGNVTFSEKRNMTYELDRGTLDSVRQGDDVPVEVKLEFVYEFVKASNGEAVTPVEAIKGINGASTFITSSSDSCEPFSVTIVIEHRVPCGDTDGEITPMTDFRWEGLDYDLKAATISVSGKCKITDIDAFRGTLLEWEQSLIA